MSDADTRTVELEPAAPPIDELVDAETRKTKIILKRPTVTVTSFLGRPADGGPLAQEVSLERRGEVVLVWETRGAERVTLARAGSDGKRAVVQEDLDFQGELETDVTDFETTFTLEAAGPPGAKTAVELAEVKVHAGSPLRIESFLGRPAEGGELTKELTVEANGKVVLVWKVVGATEVAISKRGKDGKRRVVDTGLELEGELEVVADEPDQMFILEAGDDPRNLALEQVHVKTRGPVPPPRPTSPRASLTGAPVNAAAPKDPRRFTVLPAQKVLLTWSASNADAVVLVEHLDGQRVRTPLSGSGGTLERTPRGREDVWTIEATRGGETARDAVEVTVEAPARPTIVSFTFEEPETRPDGTAIDDKLRFDWRVAGPAAKVQLVPYGDVTAETKDGVGLRRAAPAGGPEVQLYTLEVFDAAGTRTDSRTLERRLRLAPKVDVTATFGGFVVQRLNHTPVDKLDQVLGTEQVRLVADVKGPFKRAFITPGGVGALKVPPGGSLHHEVTVDPNTEAGRPGTNGLYTLIVDDKLTKTVQVVLANPIIRPPIEVKVEYEFPLVEPNHADTENWFTFELKAFGGFKLKLVANPNETAETIEVALGSKREMKLDVGKEFKFDEKSDAPKWVITHVEKLKESVGPKVTLEHGKISADVSIAWELTFREQTIRGVRVVPKAALEIAAIKLELDKKKGWKFVSPGTLTFKGFWEFPLPTVELKKYGLPWDIKEAAMFGGFSPIVSPNLKKIVKEIGTQLRNAAARLGWDAASVGFAVVMVVLVIAFIVFVVGLMLNFFAFLEARRQWALACKLHRRLMAGAPEGLADEAVDLLPPVEDASALPQAHPDDVAAMRRQGKALGQACRQQLQKRYREQPDMQAALDGLFAGLADELPDPAARRRKVDETFLELFRNKMVETKEVVRGNVSHHLFFQIRKGVHVRLCERTGSDAGIRDASFRTLFIGAHAHDEPDDGSAPDGTYAKVGRETHDYDLPEVDDELFERAMTDQWLAASAVASGVRKDLEDTWAKLGYDGKDARPPRTDPATQFSPERHGVAVTRDMRRAKRKRKTPLMQLFEVRDGQVREDSGALSSTRDALLSELPDRGLVVRGVRQDLLTILKQESWTDSKVCDMTLGGWGAMGKNGQQRITMPVVSGARDLDRAAVAIWSSDHGFEFIVADVVPPAILRVHPTQPPPPVLVEVSP